MITRKHLTPSAAFGVLALLFAAAWSVWAVWSPPTQAPPGGNVAAPLHTGISEQTKEGSVKVKGDVEVHNPTSNDSVLTVDILDVTPGNATFAGKVGIGTTSPDGTLHVHTASAGTVTANPSLDDLVVENNADAGISILTPSSNVARIGFGDSTDSFVGSFLYNHATDSFSIIVNDLEAMRINSSANVGIGTATPNEKLEIQGGMRLNTTAAKPTCDSTKRGTLWFTQGGAGVKDALEICAKDPTDVYAWRLIL